MVWGRLGVVAGAALLAGGVGCGGGGTGAIPGVDGGAADSGIPLSTSGCPDLFDQDKVRSYSIEIDPVEWQNMVDEFNNLNALLTDENWGAFHPAVLRVFEQKWQSLPRFQRTRGVLRMLALWVSHAYQEEHRKAASEP